PDSPGATSRRGLMAASGDRERAGQGERGVPARSWQTPETIAGRALVAAGAAALGCAMLFLRYAADMLLMAFAGVLLAVFLCALRDGLRRCTRLPAHWSLPAVVVGLAGLFGLAVWLLAPAVATSWNGSPTSCRAPCGGWRGDSATTIGGDCCWRRCPRSTRS